MTHVQDDVAALTPALNHLRQMYDAAPEGSPRAQMTAEAGFALARMVGFLMVPGPA